MGLARSEEELRHRLTITLRAQLLAPATLQFIRARLWAIITESAAQQLLHHAMQMFKSRDLGPPARWRWLMLFKPHAS